MKKLVYSFVVLLATYAGVMAQQKSTGGADEAAIRALEEKWDVANLKADVKVFDAMLADNYFSTDPEGNVQTKKEFLAELKSGDIKYQTSKGDDIKVFPYGDAAVVNGRWRVKFVRKGKTVPLPMSGKRASGDVSPRTAP